MVLQTNHDRFKATLIVLLLTFHIILQQLSAKEIFDPTIANIPPIIGTCGNETTCGPMCKKLLTQFTNQAIKSQWHIRHPTLNKLYQTKHCQVCVEIGVARGELTQSFLENVPTIKSYAAVDPFLGGYDSKDLMSRWLENEKAGVAWAQAVMYRMRDYGCKFKMYHGKSEDMVQHFANHSIDCIFVDGDHTYEGVKLDIDLWHSKLRPGGTFFFDDVSTVFMGVVRAVDEFAEKYNLRVVRINTHNNYYITID